MKLAVMTRNTSLFRLICRCFEADGAVCSRFADDVALARAVYREDFTAILVDAETGVSPLRPVLARRTCYADRRAPLIVVGAVHDRASITDTLDAGADDIVLAPIDSRELVLRVHLALRRFQTVPGTPNDDDLECGAYRLDRGSCTVQIEGDSIRLTSREFAIAWLLFSRPGEYVSRRQIAGAVWSSSEDIVGRTLEQHIYKLRKKLNLNGAHGVHLRTMYAHGYRIERVDVPLTEAAAPGLTYPQAPIVAPLDASTGLREPAVAITHVPLDTVAVEPRRLDALTPLTPLTAHAAHRQTSESVGPEALARRVVAQHAEIHPVVSSAACDARP